MLIAIDLLAKLRPQAHTRSSLASVLPASEEETQQALDRLMHRGWVSGAPAGYDADSMIPVYTITPDGSALYDRVLDRWANQLMGPPEMSVHERFLAALANDAPAGLCEQILGLLDDAPAAAGGSRPAALSLAQCAGIWARQALEADRPINEAAVLGIKSVPTTEAEDLGYLAAQIRESDVSAGCDAVAL